MLDLLQYRAWALDESYFFRMHNVLTERLHLGHSLDGLIHKKSQEDYLPMIEALLSVEEGHPPIDAALTQVNIERDNATGLPMVRSNGKNIALLSVVGPLAKYGGLCSMGMQDYQSIINKANNSASIDGLVLVMDTPGGTVDGTPELGLAIKTSAKPIGVFGDNMVASAGLWLASQASIIVGNINNPTQFGSIGVLMGLPNYQNVMDAGNLPTMRIFRATQSTEKALVNSVEPISVEAEAALQDQLDSTADAFISTVKAGRGDKLDTNADGIFSGRMFGVYDAKKIGLIDSIGSLQTAINKVAELAKQKQNGTTPGKGNANTTMFKGTKLAALFGKSGKEATTAQASGQESLAIDQASMDAAEETLANMEAKITSLTAAHEAALAKATQLETTVTELTTQVTTLTGEKEKLTTTVAEQKVELEKKPTGNLTTVIPGANEESQAADQGATTKKISYETSIDVERRKIQEANAQNTTFK